MNKQIQNDLINYAAGGVVNGYTSEQMDVFAEFIREWDALDCDNEGFNQEQEKIADKLIAGYAEKISAMEK